jgi:hypothetical protein
MRIKISTQRIKKLNPCRDRLDNWLKHYPDFEGGITEFLRLENITPQDKIWVAVRVMPRFLGDMFAIDCAMHAAAAAADAVAAYTGAAYAADAAADAERQRQMEALIYLISTTTKKECEAL